MANNKGKIAYMESSVKMNGTGEGAEGSSISTLKIANEDGTNQKVIVELQTDGRYIENLSWSPDGSYLAIYGSLLEVVKIGDLDGKPIEILDGSVNASSLLGFTWSADSKRIAYFIGSSPVKLEIYDIESQKVVKSVSISNKKYINTFSYEMAWTSQDTIIYLSNTESKILKLLSYNVSSGSFGEKVIASDVDETSGTRLLFYPNKNKGLVMLKDLKSGDEIWSVDGNGGSLKKVWSVGNLDTCGIEGWITSMSYDSRYVVANLGCPRPLPENFKKRSLDPASFLIDTETGTYLDATKNIPLTVSPDNKYFIAKNEVGLGIYDIKGQKTSQFVNSKTDEYAAWNPK